MGKLCLMINQNVLMWLIIVKNMKIYLLKQQNSLVGHVKILIIMI